MSSANSEKPTVVIGLGNPVLTDDTAGLKAAELVEKKLTHSSADISFKQNFSGGFDLMYELAGYSNAIIIDSIFTGQADPGFCHELSVGDLAIVTQPRLVNSHGLNLPTVLKTGVKCGYTMPDLIVIFGIEGRDFSSFSEHPTQEVLSGLEEAANKIINRLKSWEITGSLKKELKLNQR